MSGERMLSTAEVAELLNVTPRAVSRWASDGRIASVELRVGLRPMLRFREGDVRAFIARYVRERPAADPDLR